MNLKVDQLAIIWPSPTLNWEISAKKSYKVIYKWVGVLTRYDPYLKVHFKVH